MEKQEYDALVQKLQSEAEGQFEKMRQQAEDKINAYIKDNEGKVSVGEFEKFKAEELKQLTEKASKLEDALRTQGEIINGLKEAKPAEAGKSLQSIVEENVPKLKELYHAGTGFIKVEVKAATLTSIGNTVSAMDSPPSSPYAPGIGGGALTLYDILRNPNFVTNYVNMGRTNQSRLAWMNEIAYNGSPAIVAEGQLKPLTSHQFKVEYSVAKKAAAYIQLTEEFDADLPGLSTQVRRMLENDVTRFFDDYIQQDVINNSTPLDLSTAPMSGFVHSVFDATFWDALLVMATQVRINNFIPNVSLVNPVLWAKMQMGKDTIGRYNYPADSFQSAVNPVQGNKIFGDNALAGDLRQFNVDIYEDFVLKMGWINDDLIRNQFTIVGEIRFHDYISTARKRAIVYGNAKYAAEQINGASNVITGS